GSSIVAGGGPKSSGQASPQRSSTAASTSDSTAGDTTERARCAAEAEDEVGSGEAGSTLSVATRRKNSGESTGTTSSPPVSSSSERNASDGRPSGLAEAVVRVRVAGA